jgi:hypothetical protein
MFDYFVAEMTCPSCNTVSSADASTHMQTHIRDDARGLEIGVGFELDPLEVRDQDLVESGYLAVRDRVDDQVSLLEQWVCATCHQENWARVSISGTTILAIAAVPLDRQTLATANFITRHCFVAAAAISGIPARDLLQGKVDPVAVLLERLP